MSQVLLFVLLGLCTGGLYALGGVGLVLVYRGSGVINFSQGAVGAVGAYLFWELNQQNGWPFFPALICGCLAAAAIGVLTHFLVMRPLRRASPLVRLVGTIGVLTVLQGALSLKFPEQAISVPSSLPTATIKIFGAAIGEDRIIIIGISIALSALLAVVYKYTRFGLQTSAVSENPQVAAALGHSPDLIAAANWALGSVLAALAGCLLVPIIGLQVSLATIFIVPMLASAVVGNFRSFPITVIAAMGIGVIQSLISRYWNFTGGQTAVPFIIIVIILIFRGSRLPGRGVAGLRLPRVGSGAIRPVPLAAGTVALVALIAFGSDNWIASTTLLIAVMSMLLSIVVLTGYAGQLSLAQFIIAGLGAWVAGRLVAWAGFGFGVAALVAIVSMVPVGLVIGLPALRARGENLAVVTLGIAVAVEAIIFGSGSLTGGFIGTEVGSISLFGIQLNPIMYPRSYAIFALVCFLILVLVVANLRRGRSGRRLIAVRSNERAAAALGVDITRAKVFAFVLASVITAVGGILYAFQFQVIQYSSFDSFTSITLVGLAVIGGLGYVGGTAIGACLFAGSIGTALINSLFGQSIESWLPLISGIALLLNLLQTPDGSGLAASLAAPVQFMARKFPRLAVLGFGPPRRTVWVTVPGEQSGHAERMVRALPLQVEGLTVRYGGVTALSDLSLTVTPGQVVGVIGPNGAGKTTLLDAITGFARPSEGTITLGGRDLADLRPDRRTMAGLGRSWQALELFEDMSVRENLLVATDPQNGAAYLRDLVAPRRLWPTAGSASAIEEFQLAGHLDARPSELSYGQRRLVAVARAVAAEPAVLLLDEPAAGLDSGSRAELARLIRRLADVRSMGVLLVEHDVDLVMSVCDHIVVLDFGRRIASGPPAVVRADERVIAAYVGAEEETATDAVSGIEGA